jgi:TnpA family transposase
LKKITPHWDDMLRLVGSLKLGMVPAIGIMRTLQVGDQPTGLAKAIAEYGRADKTMHTLTYIDDEAKRRSTLTQLNRGEGRHRRLSPLSYGHINMLGRYSFSVPEAMAKGELRPLRDSADDKNS